MNKTTRDLSGAAAELKNSFSAGKIPKASEYETLIDLADAGYKGVGGDGGGPGVGLALDAQGVLKVHGEDLAGDGLVAAEAELTIDTSVLAGSGLFADGSALSVVVHGDGGLSVGAGGVGLTPGTRAVPIGTIMMWASDAVPAGWLLCDGSTITQGQYPMLVEALGGQTTLPDLRGRYPAGGDGAQSVGDELDAITGMPDGFDVGCGAAGNHKHGLKEIQYDAEERYGKSGGDKAVAYSWHDVLETLEAGEHSHTMSAVSSYSSSETRPRTLVLNFIIAADV